MLRRPILPWLLLLTTFLIACGSDSDTNDNDDDERPAFSTYSQGAITFNYPRGWVVDYEDRLLIGGNSQAAIESQEDLTAADVQFELFEAHAVLDLGLPSGSEPTAFLAALLTDVDDSVFGQPTITNLGVHPVAYVVGNDGVVDAFLLVMDFENDRYIIMSGIGGEGALGQFQDELLDIAASIQFSPSPALVRVFDRRWERTIVVEQYQTLEEGDWCDSLPADAYSVTQTERQRTTRQIPSGEECNVVREDQGDGTVTERTECTTTYREEPVMDNYCDYSVDRWAESGHVTTAGGTNEEPVWGELNLQRGDELGAEREGGREEHYFVGFYGEIDDREFECDVDAAEWGDFELESRWTMTTGYMTATPDCASLQAVSD